MLEPASNNPREQAEDPVLAKVWPIIIIVCIGLLFLGSAGAPPS